MPTLYVKEQGTVLSLAAGRIVGQKAGKTLLDMPAVQIERVVLMGNVHLTTPLTAFLLEQNIDTVFLSSHGRYRGRLQPSENSNVSLRRRQYALAADPAFCLGLTRSMITAKLSNQAALIARRKNEIVRRAAAEIRHLADRAGTATELDSLRGYEGTAARLYFAAFATALKSAFRFAGRVKHPATDPVNVLLSLGYTLLFADMLAALYVAGFDPFVGFFHQERSGHAALASDLMEEFRAPIVDVVVLSLCNREAITPDDFRRERGGNIRLGDQGAKRLFEEYERRLETRVLVPVMGQQFTYRGAMEQQTRCLADVINGKRTVYIPFEMRQ